MPDGSNLCALCDSGDVVEGKLCVQQLWSSTQCLMILTHELHKTLQAVHNRFQEIERTRWGQHSSSMPRSWIAIDGAPRPAALALATEQKVTADDVLERHKHSTLVSRQTIKSLPPLPPHLHYTTPDTPNNRATLPTLLLFPLQLFI